MEETLGEIPDNEDDISSYQINDIKYGENSYPSIDKKTVYYEIVLVDDQYEKEQRIKFGAIFILEGMAYIIEKCAYSSQNLPLLRYNIARNIVKYVLKNDISDSDFINICDASLQSQNPGLTFFNILNTIKNYPSIDDAINSFTLTEKKYPIWKAPNLLRSDNIFENILSNIGNSHYRQDIKTYIEKMIDSALIYRDKNPFLFKNLSIEIKNHTTSLREMYNNFGTPNIFNIDNVFLGSIPISTENHTGLTKMILICSFLEKINNKYRKTFKCPLYETCLRMNTCPNIFDEYICENDFRKLENTGEMCIAYALAQNMGLLNII